MLSEMDKLKESEERFRIIFENAADGVFVSSADGVFTDVNASGCRLLGYEPGELIGKSVVEVLPPHEIARFFDTRESLLAGHTKFEEWTLLRRDGSLVETETSSQMLPDGRLLAFVRNITERKRAEELRKRQTRHNALRAEVQAAFSSSEKSLQNVLQSNMESIVRHLDAAFARVWLLDEERQVLELQASAGIYTHIDGKHSRFEVGQYKIGMIAAQKEFFYSNAILEIEIIDKAWATREGLVSFAGFPLIVNDKVVGVAGMFSRHLLTEDTLEVFKSIAVLIAQGVVRKQAEDLLREKQELLQAFFDFSTELIHVKDPEGRCLMTNRVFEEVLQLSGKDCYGKTELELWQASPAIQGNPRKSIEDYRDFDTEVFKTGEVAQKVEVFEVGDHQRIFLTIKKPLNDAAGKPYVIFSISTDITERKRAEDKLRAEQQLLQAMFDNTPTLINVKDLDGRFMITNRAFEQTARISREELLGKTLYDIWKISPFKDESKEKVDDVSRLDLEALKAGETIQKEHVTVLDGEERTYLMTKCPLKNDAGEPYSILTIAADITEIKRAEKELRANQQLLQAIFDNTPALMNVKDLDRRIVMINRAFEKSLGLPREEILGKTAKDLWRSAPAFKDEPEEYFDTSREFDLEVLEAGKAIQREDVSWFEGLEQTYLMTKCPIKNDAGEPNSILTIATNITEIKRAEKELRRLQTELAHAARVMTMGTLANSIAHEVNQPLAAVVTNGNACLRWLAVDPPDLEEARDAVNRIIRDGIRASEVIERTRTLLKKSPPHKHALEINEIAKETVALAQYEIQKNKIFLETQFSTNLPAIEGDKIQLQQVLLNLIMNGIEAIKAVTDGETRLSVETRQDEDDNILVAVGDSGIGLDLDNLDRIFESFYTTKKEGMGMGLSISRSIIEAHGGRLWATANETKGATFQFTLPIRTSE